MQIRIFTFPLETDEPRQEELNLFLRSHKVVDVRRELASSGGNAFWTFCVTYLQDSVQEQMSGGKPVKVDYKTVLDEDAFAVFSELRKIRKELAEMDAVPAYAVFTDAELAELSKSGNVSEASLSAIPGIGKKRVEKYGKTMCDKFNARSDEASLLFGGENS